MDEITVGARLRTLRRWRGMTQAELAVVDRARPLSELECFLLSPEADGTGLRVAEENDHPAPVRGLAGQQPVEVGPQLMEEHRGVHQDADPALGLPELEVSTEASSSFSLPTAPDRQAFSSTIGTWACGPGRSDLRCPQQVITGVQSLERRSGT